MIITATNTCPAEAIILDVGSTERYDTAHAPGAYHIKAAKLHRKHGLAMLTPSFEELVDIFGHIGLNENQPVVVMDDCNGMTASRAIWCLALIGVQNIQYYDGGFAAYQHQGGAITDQVPSEIPSQYPFQNNEAMDMDSEEILSKLEDSNWVVWDARTEAEFSGVEKKALQSGHIPNAVNLPHHFALTAEMRLKPLDEIQALLNQHGLTSDKYIVTHCQGHVRSAFTFMLMKMLGYPHAYGYSGSWADWGNNLNLPVEHD